MLTHFAFCIFLLGKFSLIGNIFRTFRLQLESVRSGSFSVCTEMVRAKVYGILLLHVVNSLRMLL